MLCAVLADTHEVRTMVAPMPASSASCSPASFDAP